MRDSNRIEIILTLIDELWMRQPDLRLCQLLSNVARLGGWRDADLYHLEDEDLRRALLDEVLKKKYPERYNYEHSGENHQG